MEAMLKATEVAQLMGCSKEYVTRMAREGRLEHEKTLNERNRPMLLFPVSGLEPQLQQKYYAQLKANLPEVRLPDGAGPKCKTPKAFDQYTADEREEIAWWLKTVDEWQTYRAKYPGKKAEADEKFIALCAKIDPEHEFSIDILYRKWKAVKDNDLDGLIDKRGKWRKGKSSIDETLWQAFLSFYLDENQHPIMRCYEYTKMWAREDFPDLVADMPSYTTFYRRIQSDIPEAVEVLGRQGEKAFRDRCAPYIKRTYDDMASNEWWIADNHTFDIITMGANGKRHRLYLTAFFDARSGIFTGCHVTTAPSSQSTLVALRKGILKYGIPENIYVDNGREFLTYDIGGLGHRQKKPKNGQEPFSPPPVFERLGIKMTNAIVRNAKAKIIERRFEDIKNQLSRLFETYTGGNVLEKPEKLKGVLKNGEIPMDSTLITVVEQLLEGYFNEAPYGGAVAADHRETQDTGLPGAALQETHSPGRRTGPYADAEFPPAEGDPARRPSGHCRRADRLLERRYADEPPGQAGIFPLRPGRSERSPHLRPGGSLHHVGTCGQHRSSEIRCQQGRCQGGHGQGSPYGAAHQGGPQGQRLPRLRQAHRPGVGYGIGARRQNSPTGCPGPGGQDTGSATSQRGAFASGGG